MSDFDSDKIRRFVLRVEFIPYVIFSIIGVAVLYVVGSILVNAISNRSLIPPPTKLERYDCTAPSGNFSIFYLHGTDRVQVKSANGIMEGTVHQNKFDWQGFADDRSLLGFAPPTEILYEDSKSMRIYGSDLQDIACSNTADASSHQRVLSQ
jgi:hypothetical protein